jgi:hypothetical protein
MHYTKQSGRQANGVANQVFHAPAERAIGARACAPLANTVEVVGMPEARHEP